MLPFTDLLDSDYKIYLNLQRTFNELLSAEITLYTFMLIIVNISEFSGSTKYGKFFDQLSDFFSTQGLQCLGLLHSNLVKDMKEFWRT